MYPWRPMSDLPTDDRKVILKRADGSEFWALADDKLSDLLSKHGIDVTGWRDMPPELPHIFQARK